MAVIKRYEGRYDITGIEKTPQRYCGVLLLRLLEGEMKPACEGLAGGIVAAGCDQIGDRGSRLCNANRIGHVGTHDVIGITISNLGLEAGKEMFLAAIPGDDDFNTGYLMVVAVDHRDLHQAVCQVGIAYFFIA